MNIQQSHWTTHLMRPKPISSPVGLQHLKASNFHKQLFDVIQLYAARDLMWPDTTRSSFIRVSTDQQACELSCECLPTKSSVCT